MNRYLVSSISVIALALAACTSGTTDLDRAEPRALPTRAPILTSDDPVADVVDQVLPSVTSGIVSSLSRRITVPDRGCTECPNGQRVYTDVIQTDAAINPGNSGGPLVDMAGNVIGINSAGTSAAENIGFAIQINSVTPTITQAAEEPGEPVAFMGIGSTDASDPNFQFQFGTPVEEGAGIVNVVPGGPADQAGVELGDVVVSFSGESIPDSEALGEAIRSQEPGDTVEFEVVRATGERVTLSVELGVNPAAIA